MCKRGIYAGIVCGALYGTILVPIIGTIVGGFIGSYMGLALGIGNGLVLKRMTKNKFESLIDFEKYQKSASIRCTLLSSLGVALMMVLLVYGWWLKGTEAAQTIQILAIYVIIPSSSAGIAALFMSRRAMQWYKMNSEIFQSEPGSLDIR
jgi:hypothetical protein